MNSSSQVRAWLPFPTPSSSTYSSSGSARRAARSSQSRNSSRMSSLAASVFRASLSPPGRDCSYSRPVACSQTDSACQYSALNRQMQLSRPGTQGSRASPDWSDSACLTSPARSPGATSPQRRRSTASSTSVLPIGLATTASRKLLRYWIQSQTTRSRDRSAGEAHTASMIGPSAARVSADWRSFLTGRRSTSIAAHPEAGPVQDAGDGLLVPGDEQVHPGHARDLAHLLDDLGGQPDPLRGRLVRRDLSQPAVDLVRHVHPRHLVAHVIQAPQRPDGADAGQDGAPPRQPQVADLRHPPPERRDVEHVLRLHELRPGVDLLGEPVGPELHRRGERVLDRAEEAVGRRVEPPPGQ